jgi:hypothetical protein
MMEAIWKLREALEIIAGRRQSIDNLLSNQQIACLALDTEAVLAEAAPRCRIHRCSS